MPETPSYEGKMDRGWLADQGQVVATIHRHPGADRARISGRAPETVETTVQLQVEGTRSNGTNTGNIYSEESVRDTDTGSNIPIRHGGRGVDVVARTPFKHCPLGSARIYSGLCRQ